MSIDISWPTLTSGPDGDRLASQIRDFIHDKFQAVTLPRFIQSVQVHSFDFGSVAPDVELKDIGDPLGDFYEGEGEGGGSSDDGDDSDDGDESGYEEDGWRRRRRGREDGGGEDGFMSSSRSTLRDARYADNLTRSAAGAADTSTSTFTPPPPPIPPQPPAYSDASFRPPVLRTGATADPSPFSLLLGRSPTPIAPGGTSTLNHYFHSPLTTGLSGTQTPLAAVAGAHLPSGWLDHTSAAGAEGGRSNSGALAQRQDSTASVESLSPPSTANSSTAKTQNEESAASTAAIPPPLSPSPPSLIHHHRRYRRRRLPRPSDFQVIARVRYSGDIALSLTAMILLDYPMPSFVGIPVKLNITGLSFDGVAVLAFIRRKSVHFCFLDPEDAAGMGVGSGGGGGEKGARRGEGGLLREIKVESEIGQREGGKQSLKNVGKVEKFVLEQVRRIFEEEFVYPSFWTFLV